MAIATLAVGGCGRESVPGYDVAGAASVADTLATTDHAPLPATLDEAWLVPTTDTIATPGEKVAADGVSRLQAGDYSAAIQLFGDKRAQGSPLASWATYYAGAAHLRAARAAEAMRVLEPLVTTAPSSALADLAARAYADAAESAGDLPRSLSMLAALADRPTGFPDEVLKRLAEVASKAGEGGRARAAWLRLYYEHPLSLYASLAEPVAAEARATASADGKAVLARDLTRAEALFAARRYSDARVAFTRLLPQTTGDTREVAELRIAECDYFARNYRAAVDRLEPFLSRASRKAEARFFHLSAQQKLGRTATYPAQVRALVDEFPESSWSEEALNNLATAHILANDDAAAADAFKEIIRRFPTGRYAPRAAWKYGWWQYKVGNFAEAATVFEQGSIRAPRSDHRPAWLYWAGRAREALGQTVEAGERYRIVYADYCHTYYGRLASRRLPKTGGPLTPVTASSADAADTSPTEPGPEEEIDDEVPEDTSRQPAGVPVGEPPNADLIRRLIAAQLWDEATLEIDYAQRVWGRAPKLEATLAYIWSRKGDLRRGITLMKRAYPQYMTDGGENLPRPIIQIIFPVAHWDLIRKYAVARRLDPHVVAALIAQESTFEAGVRSHANAWGLMQILPSTGRRLARAEGLRSFSTAKLTDAETNVRLGTRYFASLIDRFGAVHYALASYNAGESRVVRWRAERPGLTEDEFIDDIPFPETQNYVKKILGTAADYRRLYPIKSTD